MDGKIILGFDIGNTSTILGIYHPDKIAPVSIRRFPTEKKITPDILAGQIQSLVEEYGNISRNTAGPVAVVISSVAPEINESYRSAAENSLRVPFLCINHQSAMTLKIRYTNPAELGVDRIVNAEAGLNEYGGGILIIDIGTAATFCAVLDDGTFDGGIIAPGIGTTIKALAENASNLPPVDFDMPDSIIARDTVNAIKSGFFYGWISLIEGLIEKIFSHYGRELRVIMTGGFAASVTEHIRFTNIHDPLLTMKGIKYIYNKNMPG